MNENGFQTMKIENGVDFTAGDGVGRDESVAVNCQLSFGVDDDDIKGK